MLGNVEMSSSLRVTNEGSGTDDQRRKDTVERGAGLAIDKDLKQQVVHALD